MANFINTSDYDATIHREILDSLLRKESTTYDPQIIEICEEYRKRIDRLYMELRVSDDQEKEVVYEKIEEEKTDRDKQVSKWLTSRNVLIFVARHYEKNRPSDWRIYAPIVNARHFKEFMHKGGSPIGFVEESRDGNIIVYGKKFAIKW